MFAASNAHSSSGCLVGNVVIHEGMKRSRLCLLLQNNYNIIYTTKNELPDILITDVSPSLAILIIDDVAVNSITHDESKSIELYKRINSIEKKFSNAYIFIIESLNNDIHKPASTASIGEATAIADQLSIKLSLPSKLRLIVALDYEEIAHMISKQHKHLKNTSKRHLQDEFFRASRDFSQSSDCSKKIYSDLLQMLAIPYDDVQIIMECFPSLKSIVNVTYTQMIAICPCDVTSIEKVIDFFNLDYKRF